MTLEELKKLYGEKGATEKRYTDTEQGRTEDYIPIQYGDGWSAFENDNRKIIDYIGQGMDATPVYDDAPKTLGGFSKQEGDYVTSYDPEGKYLGRQKWNESNLKTMIQDLGPLAMAALTMGGGAGMLGNSLFGLTGTAAAGAGGALAGGINAYGNDQNILKGALTGALAGGGAQEIGNTGLKLSDVNNAANAIKNKDVLGLLSSGAGAFDTSGIDIGGLNVKDAMKYAGLAKNALSGTDAGLFKAITGLAGDQNLNNAFNGGIDSKDFTEGYFLPGGEGYIDPMSKTEGVTGPGYYDEITGRYIKDDLGGLTNPLGRETGNLDPNSKWEYSLTRPGVWSNGQGEEIDLSYLPNTEKVMTGAEIMEKAGAMLKKAENKAATPDKKTDATTNKMMQNFGLNYAQAPSQDPFADIKSMENIFGSDIAYNLRSLKGSDTAKKPASNSMDALTKLLRG